ncbi:sodium:solute symporter family protein [Fulvivirgaceae bacterium BMA12]|uniref:Sodium:solute symporter family protein n=1 Tax=Agaribacillus aureus TaxID=3051825 RepID=A0ABT8L6S2_9BACT|nr:sodium:solute symporter family protein [Fulvivirgaceae bacterium BMA12]
MSLLDYIVIALFTVMILVVGVAFSRTGGNMKSYFAAGGSLPWWLSGLSLFMSFFSAGTFVIWGSIAYQYGWVSITIQWMMALSGFIIGYFIAPKWRETNSLTAGEFLGKRFSPSLKKFYSYIFLVLSFVTTGAFLYPVAKIFNVSTGFSIELSILILGLLIIIYTAAGGLWAVVITDVLQFVILFAAVIIVVPLALEKIGGPGALIHHAPEGFFSMTNGAYSFGFLMAFTFYNTFFIGGNWAYVQRYTSVRTPRDARKVGLLFGSLYLVSPVLWMLPPMIFRLVDGNLTGNENEGAFLLMCKAVLPKGLLGLMLGGMIFATASSVNTTLNMSAAVFTNDIYKKLKKGLKQATIMKIARLSTVVFGIITIGVALAVPRLGGIVEVVLTVGAVTGAPLFGPPIWALFSNWQTSFSMMTTTLVSLGINLFLKFMAPGLLGFSLNRAEEMLTGVFIPIAILAGFEMYYRFNGTSNHSLQKNDEMTGGEAAETTKNETSAQNTFAIRVLAIALLLTGSLISLLGVIASDGKLIVLCVGITVLLTGGLLLTRKYVKRESKASDL